MSSGAAATVAANAASAAPSADPDRIYQATNFIAFPRNNGPPDTNNFWTGTSWDWFNGNPPWSQIGRTFMHPNGLNTGPEHWVIRRYVSEVGGRVTVDWTLAKSSQGGSGVTGRVLHNGTQRDAATISGTDTTGVNRSVTLTNDQAGDFIDIALDPTGLGGATDDSADGSTMTAVIRGASTLCARRARRAALIPHR